jgi:alkylation response protein AidB-like acyl-CoA dehydrogenase
MQLPTPEQNELRAISHKVLMRNATSERIREVAGEHAGHDRALWEKIADLGWLALTIPEDHDGLGLGLAELAILAEEFGYTLQPSPFVTHSLATWLLGRHGSAALQSRLLPALATGDMIAACGLQDPAERRALTLNGDRLNGVQRFVPHAAQAGVLVLDALADEEHVVVLVDVADAGDTLQAGAQHTMDLTRPYATVVFDGTPVSTDAVISVPMGRTELWQAAIALQCAESVGVTSRLVDMTVSYAATRRQFGRPIGSFQAIKHRIADMHIDREGAAAATEEAACAVQRRRSDAAVAVHVAKSWTGRAASSVASEALQLHGGIGFTWEHDLHLFMRRAKVNELLLGQPGWHDEQLFDALVAGTA